MNELIKIQENENYEPTVSGRDLHSFLEVKTPYRSWFPRMCEYGFESGVDYTPYNFVHPLNNQETQDHFLKIDMAKEIAMLQRSEKGKEVRKYFIEVEKRYNNPEYIMARALRIANNTIKEKTLEIENLNITIEEQKPKVDYYDKVTDSKKAIGMGEVAKLIKFKDYRDLDIGRNKLFEILRYNKVLNEYNEPYQKYVNQGYFEVVQSFNKYTGNPTYTTLVTSKGIGFIIKLLRKLGYKENV